MWLRWCLVALALLASGAAGAVVIGADERLTFSQFAKKHGIPLKKLKTDLGATGMVVCGGGGGGTGQVTARNDVITTAGHIFYDDQCNPRFDPRYGCEFRTLPNPNLAYEIDLDSLKTGVCGGGPFAESRRVPDQNGFLVTDAISRISWWVASDDYSPEDWAVAKLKKPVPGTTPYQLPDARFPVDWAGYFGNRYLLEKGQKLIHVSAGDADLPTPSITLCQFSDAWTPDATWRSDCDTNNGSSGAAQLLLPKDFPAGLSSLTIVAINVAHPHGSVAGGEFNLEDQSNLIVPMDWYFWAAVKATLDQQ